MSEALLSPQDVTAIATAVASQILGQPPQRFLTVAQAGKYTGLSEESIRRLLSSGKLSGLRPIKGRILIDRRALDALILASTPIPRRGRGIKKEKK